MSSENDSGPGDGYVSVEEDSVGGAETAGILGHAGEGEGDGMAQMMSRILNQKVESSKIPVLAKRKTALMKEMEEDKLEKDRTKQRRIERRAQQTKQMVDPKLVANVSTTADQHLAPDFERQLRKLATRGVVALFNAISKSKRESNLASKPAPAATDTGKDTQHSASSTAGRGSSSGSAGAAAGIKNKPRASAPQSSSSAADAIAADMARAAGAAGTADAHFDDLVVDGQAASASSSSLRRGEGGSSKPLSRQQRRLARAGDAVDEETQQQQQQHMKAATVKAGKDGKSTTTWSALRDDYMLLENKKLLKTANWDVDDADDDAPGIME